MADRRALAFFLWLLLPLASGSGQVFAADIPCAKEIKAYTDANDAVRFFAAGPLTDCLAPQVAMFKSVIKDIFPDKPPAPAPATATASSGGGTAAATGSGSSGGCTITIIKPPSGGPPADIVISMERRPAGRVQVAPAASGCPGLVDTQHTEIVIAPKPKPGPTNLTVDGLYELHVNPVSPELLDKAISSGVPITTFDVSKFKDAFSTSRQFNSIDAFRQ